MMELEINGKVGIVVDDNNQAVIFDKKIVEEMKSTKDANGNNIDFIEKIND